MFSELFDVLSLTYFFLSAIIFVGGLYYGPIAVEKEITVLLRYPRWIHDTMERYFKTDFHFLLIFFLIFILNNVSLFSGFISGFIIIGPLLAAFYTGFNVSVITFDMMGWKGIWHILTNPVAWLEFPAAWISFGLGFQIAELQMLAFNSPDTFALFDSMLPIYISYVAGLLLVAAIVETGIIVIGRKMMDTMEKDDDESQDN